MGKDMYYDERQYEIEFSDICGQETVFVRRVLYVFSFCAKIEHSTTNI